MTEVHGSLIANLFVQGFNGHFLFVYIKIIQIILKLRGVTVSHQPTHLG